MKSLQIKLLKFLPITICFIFFYGWLQLLIIKYHFFGYYDWDLAIFSNIMWNLSHGSMYSSLIGINFLGNHINLFAFLLIPTYYLITSPLTLIILKLLSYTGGAFIFYLIAKKQINEFWALILMVLYLTFPPNIFGMLFEFDFENIAIFFIFLLYYFLQEGRLRYFLITCFLTALLKENTPLLLIPFGLFALCTKKQQRWQWGGIPILIGITIFCIDTMWISPLVRSHLKDNIAYVGLYREYGKTWLEIFSGMLIHYPKVIATIFNPINKNFLYQLFGPMIFIAPYSPHILFLGAPLFLQNLLSNGAGQHTIFFHYTATITPFIFLATLNTFGFIYRNSRRMIFTLIMSTICLLCITNIFNYQKPIKERIADWIDPWDGARWAMVKSIPPKASVVATFRFLPALSNRPEIYSLHNVWRGINQITVETPYKLPQNIEYALIDFSDDWLVYETEHDPAAKARLDAFFANGQWTLIKSYGKIKLFQRTSMIHKP